MLKPRPSVPLVFFVCGIAVGAQAEVRLFMTRHGIYKNSDVFAQTDEWSVGKRLIPEDWYKGQS